MFKGLMKLCVSLCMKGRVLAFVDVCLLESLECQKCIHGNQAPSVFHWPFI